MALYRLAPEEVERRMSLAPEGVRYWHKLLLEGRKQVDEPATEMQNARDVLLVFSTREVRHREPPYADWVGLQTDPTVLTGILTKYDSILRKVDACY